MKENKLYEILRYIIESYDEEKNEYQINAYNQPEIKDAFNCDYPQILIRKKNNYIEIVFTGEFPNYNTYKQESYTITVTRDSRISYNLLIQKRKLLNPILNYIKNYAYKFAKNKRIEDHRRKITKEQNREFDEKKDRITKMATEILKVLGKTLSRYDNYEDPGTIEYKGYGLNIILSLRNNNLMIFYAKKLVFSDDRNIYEDGIWETIFTELYDKLPVLKRQEKEVQERTERCKKLMNEVIKPLIYTHVTVPNDSLKIREYKIKSTRVNNNGSYEYDQHYSIIKNSEEVLHVVEESYGQYVVYTYIPGNWESELVECLEENRRGEEERDIKEGIAYVKQLRKLK